MLDSIKQSVIDTGIGRHKEIEGVVNGEKRFYDLVIEPFTGTAQSSRSSAIPAP